MTLSQHALTRRLKLAILIVLAGLALWIIAWLMAVSQYHKVIDGWVSTQRNAGYHVDYDDRMTVGFPHRIMLRFDNLRWQNNDAIIFKADHMDLSALPWHWQKFHAKFKGHVELDAPIEGDGTALVMGGEEGRATVELNDDGTWKMSDVSLDHAHFGRDPDYLFRADELEARAVRPDQPPKSHSETGLTLHCEALHVTVPSTISSPFGPIIDTMNVDLRVMDDMPDFRRKESLKIWNEDSGVVEFDNLSMVWGPVNMVARGTIGFDDALQPEGAFASSLEGHAAVLKALLDAGFIAQRQKAMMDSALSLFAKPDEAGHGSAINLPITIQLGGMFFGPVRIFGFPEIQWDN